MNNSFSRFGLSVAAFLMSPALLAASLNGLDVAALPGDRVELKLTFDEPIPAPRGYTIEQPARIALDLPGVSNRLGSKNREIGMGNARSLTVVEAKDRTRLIVNLTNLAPYTTRVDGNTLFVVVGDGPVSSSPSVSSVPVASPAPVVSAPAARAMAGVRSVSDIDFQRGEQGEGNIVISLSDPKISPDVQEQGGKIRIDFPKTQLPESLRVRLDVKDFATPVQFVNASSSADRASIVVEPAGLYDYLVFQADNKLTVSVKPLTEEDAVRRKADRFTYTGEKLSLNFQDIDVRSVLQLIADFTDLNLVASDTVRGNITLRLQNVPWDQALDLVLKTKGLDQRKVGNVLMVAPADEIAAREQQELAVQKQVAELAPLRKDIIQLNYAKASDIAKLYEEGSSGALKDDMRGSVIFDDRTNSLIVTLTQERIDELRRIVTQLDIPVRQVMIEARIVEANVDYDKSLGVRWGGNIGSGNWNAWGKNGNLELGEETDGVQQIDVPFNTPFVDMGVNGSTSGIGIGFITNNTVLDLQLSAMEKSGSGEVVSQPKVVTSDKETAKILKGTEVPYQEASSSGATSTSFKEAALSLEVTPQITPDNRVLMEVKVTKDAPDFSVASSTGGIPAISKNEVNAKVLVADGETIVIGGVYSNTQSKSVDKVPFLGDLPFIGRVFKRDLVQDRKAELLVFLTPRIMNNQAIAVNR
ncbi:type IV pilus secretin PilQ [Ectopseudomonas toyotomiensis]|uniref:Type IV pilus secretin PilQ n=1 Tax=Ectopseudomonas toyotomiensis TaxID=554344 RepID=A0ABD7E3I5_9GAMM|nr:type IV pilus secretin PilQ [Pseudomonas toyotomiensis]MBG0840063.1 type IV pilus secretin PilQ [Pseudomonas toyotomiensis]QSL95174.1 type IV pilus secretin PilQ [Pseudomonas toyotomiensis]